jgi:hypothetical protein
VIVIIFTSLATVIEVGVYINTLQFTGEHNLQNNSKCVAALECRFIVCSSFTVFLLLHFPLCLVKDLINYLCRKSIIPVA